MSIIHKLLLIFILLPSFAFAQSGKISTTTTAELTVCQEAGKGSFQVINTSVVSLSNVSIKVKLPIGIKYVSGSLVELSNFNITAQNVSNSADLVFSSNSIPAGDTLSFELNYTATTAAIAQQKSGKVFRNTIEVTHATGSFSDNSSAYNILYPVLATMSISPTSKTLVSGTSTTRTITIMNAGNGRLSSFNLSDIRNASELNIDSVSRGQLAGDSVLFTSSEFLTIGNGDAYFDQYESITITEHISGTSCTDKTITSTLKTHWGCSGSIITSAAKYASITLDFQSPNLTFTASETFSACFGAGQASTQQLRIINTGNGVASAPLLEIFKATNNQYNADIYSRIDAASIKYKKGTNGSASAVLNLSTTTSSSSGTYACLGNNPIGKAQFNVPSLAPGDTLFVTWDMYSCCVQTCDNPKVMGWSANLNYTDVCGTKNYSSTVKGQDNNSQLISFFSETPVDIVSGKEETYTFTVSSFENTLPQGDGASYVATFSLDNGLVYKSISFQSNGTVWSPTSTVYNASQNTVSAIFPLPIPFNLTKSELAINLEGNCGSSGWKTVSLDFGYLPDSSCTTCEIPLECDFSVTTYLHCPANNCTGVSVVDYTLSRTNFGISDNDVNGLPDPTNALNYNKIKTNRAMVGDTISNRVVTVLEGNGSSSWAYAKYQSVVDFGAVLNSTTATVTILDASSGNTYTVSGLTATATKSGNEQTFTYDLSISNLTSLNSNLSGFSFRRNDSIYIDMQYRIEENVPGLIKETTFLNEFYVSTVANPSSNQKDNCNFKHGRITLIGFEWDNSGRNNTNQTTCTRTITQNFGLSIGDMPSNFSGGNLFPFEYRHWGIVKEARVIIPSNYSFDNARIRFTRTVNTNSSQNKTISNISPDTISGDTLFFDLEKHFANGTFEYGDDGFNGTLFVDVKADCQTPQNVFEDINWAFKFEESSAINKNITAFITADADKIKYTPAVLALKSINPTQVANARLVNWDFKLDNNTNANAENTWITLNVPEAIVIDSIVNDKTKAKLSIQNNLYLVGDVANNSEADFTIYAKFTNCDTAILEVFSGYSCDGYPSSFAGVSCPYKSMNLYVEPTTAAYQTRIATQLMSNPCIPQIEFKLNITNVEISHLFDMNVSLTTPDTSKIRVVQGTSDFKLGNTSFLAISDPTLQNKTFTYSVNTIDTTLVYNGVKGIYDIPKNSFELRGILEMGANYQPGDYLAIQISGKTACTAELPTYNLAIDVNSSFEKNETAGLNLDIGNSWSASWGDYDNDGYDDLFVPINDMTKPNILYHNNGNGTFTKITTGPVVTDLGSSIAGVWGDYDNDTYLDLFVANNTNSTNKLYHNNGDGTFTSITNSPIVDKGTYSHAAAWSDYNLDGNLDLIVSDIHPTHFNFMFLGDGNGGFTEDKTSQVALSATSAVGISWGDYDNDGDPDLFIANTKGENNQLFKNEAGILKAITTGAIVTDGGTSVGGAWGDYDNDGDLDLFVTNSRITEPNFLYENNGDGTFTRIFNSELVTNISASNGASWADFDNDGYMDLMVANDQNQANYLFRNNGDKTFTKLDNAITQEKSDAYGTAWSDFDNDGDYDLIVANRGANANEFFINGKGSCTNHLIVKLVGCNSNKSGIGAMIKVKSTIYGKSIWQTKDVATQNSAMGGQNSQKILFGLGDASSVDSLIINWPSGITTIILNPNLNQLSTVYEQCGSQICGTIYHDADADQTQDSTEKGIPNLSLKVTPGNFQVFTTKDGNYCFYAENGTYSISQVSNAAWTAVAPSSGSHTVVVNQAIQTQYLDYDFGNTANCTLPDLAIEVGTTAFRRGLKNKVTVKLSNLGAYDAADSISLELTTSKTVFMIDSLWTDITETSDSLIYTYTISPLASLSEITLNLLDSVDVYSELNDTVFISGNLAYAGNECLTTNNSFYTEDVIVGSIDPNDKQVYVAKYTESHEIATTDVFNYKIRFQNLGNYEAQRVVIIDTLSENLDWSTFKMSSSSHPFSVSVVNGIVTWTNEDIGLPDSASNPLGSQGYVAFTISPKKDLPAYTQIHNKASIQFDRNAFIHTNNTTAVSGVKAKLVKQYNAVVYPNPTETMSHVLVLTPEQVAVTINQITILDYLGNTISEVPVNAVYIELPTIDLIPGTYLLRIKTEDDVLLTFRLIKL
jgi:uncharacterized repeat protein (TIGR01451 family)